MNNLSLSHFLAAVHAYIEPRKFLRCLEQFVSSEALLSASLAELQAAGCTEKESVALQHPEQKLIEQDMAWANKPNHHLICLCDDAYPAMLREIPDPPLVLYVWGNEKALFKQQLAMVGSRYPTPTGLKTAEQFAYDLVGQGLAITSGLARGIDGASHRGALRATGTTIAVLGTGLQQIYPRSHQGLAEDIVMQGGAIISEFPLSTPPRAIHFPRRNRIIAGLSKGVLVVEAARKSGSLITVRHALEQGREVFAIPGSINNLMARGCHYLIRQGAKLVEQVGDILEELDPLPAACSPHPWINPMIENQNLTPDSQQLLEKIDYAVTSIDSIIAQSGLTAGEVSSMLLILELQGHIQAVVGGYVRV